MDRKRLFHKAGLIFFVGCFILMLGSSWQTALADPTEPPLPAPPISPDTPPAPFVQPEQPGEADLPDGYILVDGDMVLPASYTEMSAQGVYTTSLWPGGVVPYQFDPNVTPDNQLLMRAAMDEWEAVADVQFVPRSSQTAYVTIQDGTANWSWVGYSGGEHFIMIYNWDYKYIMVHELGHMLGLWHEQSRNDRDSYVTINTANIQSNQVHNFNKHPEATMSGFYDFASVMHYSRYAFSQNGLPTIDAKPAYQKWQHRMGQQSQLSEGDLQVINAMYGCSHSGCPQIPANDRFENPITLGAAPSTLSGQNNTRATLAYNDPSPSCDPGLGQTVWYRYTPTVSDTVQFYVSDAVFQPVISVWTGSTRDNLVSRGCHMDDMAFGAPYSAAVDIAVTAGTTYYVLVGSVYNESGSFTVGVNALGTTPPSNDNIGAARVAALSGGMYEDTGSTNGATAEGSDPWSSCGPSSYMGKSIWYAYTATSSRVIQFMGSGNFDTALSLWQGSPGNLSELACGSGYFSFNLRVSAGTTYYFMAMSPIGNTGNVDVGVYDVGSGPSNDLISGATPITSLPYNVTPNNSAASSSADDPDCADGVNTLWYQYTTGSSGIVLNLDVTSSPTAATISVWKGTPGNLSQVACVVSWYPPVLRTELLPNTTYYIMLASSQGTSGDLALNISQFTTGLANDSFDTPTVISGLPYSDSKHTGSASLADDDPKPYCAWGRGPTLWYRFTPTLSGTIRVDLTGSEPDSDAVIAVYTGTRGNLTHKGCAQLYWSPPSQDYQVIAGTSYYIMVGASTWVTGNVTLNVSYLNTHTISGTVRAQDNNAILPNMVVFVEYYDTSSLQWQTRTICTNSTGNYILFDLPADTEITVYAGSAWNSYYCPGGSDLYTNEYWQDTQIYWQLTPITLTTAQPSATNINFTLPRSSGITATVYNANRTAPLSGISVNVYVYHPTTNDFGTWYLGCTGTNGSAVLRGMPYGFQAEVWAGGSSNYCNGGSYQIEYWQEKTSAAAATRISLAAPNYNVSFTLVAGGSISGTVLQAEDSQPVQNANVAIWNSSGLYDVTDEFGNYEIKGVPINTPLTVYAHNGSTDNPRAYEWYAESSTPQGATPVMVTSGNPNATGIDFSLVKSTTISGTVYDETGTTPLPNVAVRLDGWPWWSCTNADGQYTLYGVGVGQNYYVSAGGSAMCGGGDYQQEWWQESNTLAGATAVTPVEAGTTGINFSLIIPPLDTPALLLPAASPPSISNPRPAFSWSAVNRAISYEIQLGRTNPPDSGPIIAVTGRSYTPPASLLPLTYYWRVRAVATGGQRSAWSEVRALTIVSPPTAAPGRNLYEIANPVLRWGQVPWAIQYKVQVDDSAAFGSPAFEKTTAANVLEAEVDALVNGTYYWRVCAQASTGACTWGPADTFVIDVP